MHTKQCEQVSGIRLTNNCKLITHSRYNWVDQSQNEGQTEQVYALME